MTTERQTLSNEFTLSTQKEVAKIRYGTQVLAASALYLGSVSFGCAVAYSSPAILDMSKPNSNVHLNLQEQSLFGGLLNIGGFFGSVTAGPVVDLIGRKLCVMVTCIPFVLGWGLIMFGGCVSTGQIYLLYAGRLVTGLGLGAISIICPVYISELSSPRIRGALGTGFGLFLNTGIFIGYLAGTYMSWIYLAILSDVFPVLLLLCVLFIPESPVWLVRQKRKREAKAALRWLRGEHADVDSEYDIIEDSTKKETKMSLSDFLSPHIYKPFLLITAEFSFQQTSGISPVQFNAASIFKSATDSIDPNIASVVCAAVLVLGNAVAAILVDRAGRRILFLVSAFFVALCCFVLGGYYYVKHNDPRQAEHIWWLPLLCLVVFMFTYSLGYGSVPWVMLGEVFPPQARGVATSVLMGTIWIIAFVVTKTFVDLQEVIYDHGVFWVFGGFCIVSFVFVFKFVPETKGKSLEEIQRLFKKRQVRNNEQIINNGRSTTNF